MKKYRNVYFRINTPSYYKSKYGVGFDNQKERESFSNQVIELFIKDGWNIKAKATSSCSSTACKDKQELYLHPQSFSGVVLEENIPHIEQLLSNNELFEFEVTDLYEEVFDLSDDEYMDILESKKQEIEKDILDIYKTKRSNLYITDTWTPLQKVLGKYRLKRLTQYIGVLSSSDIDYKFIYELFEDMVDQNKIVTGNCKNGTGYRTINKTEQKQLKICLA